MNTTKTAVSPFVLRWLMVFSGAVALLAGFQWAELVVVRRGGKAVCSLNETLNCEAVWNSPLAHGVHRWLGVPVAALGLIWGVAAFWVALALWQRQRNSETSAPLVAALKLMGVVGLVAVLGFAVASATLKSLCLTCLATYLLTFGFFAVAELRLPGPRFPPPGRWGAALRWTVFPVAAVYLLALVPGIWTPKGAANGAAVLESLLSHPTQQPPAAGDGALDKFLAELPERDLQMLSAALTFYKRQDAPGPVPAPRVLWGAADAPVKIVEFTDIRCGHCRALLEQMELLEKVAPPGSISVEARHFPLDSECNPGLSMSDGTKVRCLGAKAQICLEGAPDFWELRAKMFREQESLTPEKVMEIASSGTMQRGALEQCLASPQTDAKLQADIAYAERYHPRGTPLVLLNGKDVPPFPSFLYAMALTGGRTDAPAFKRLPPPPPPPPDTP